jgi:hypothetical protein
MFIMVSARAPTLGEYRTLANRCAPTIVILFGAPEMIGIDLVAGHDNG